MNREFSKQGQTTPGTAVQIVAQTKRQLSREARRFNTLTARISKLEQETLKESEKLEKLFTLYMRDVQPLVLDHAGVMMDAAALLSTFPDKKQLGKRQRESVQDMILDLCQRSFAIIEPSAEQKAIHDRWSDVSYDDECKSMMEDSKADLEQMFKNDLGLDVDLSDIDESPESFMRLEQKIAAELEKKFDEREGARTGARKKNTKQSAAEHGRREKFTIREERERAEADRKSKSLRSIYLALAKVLHPDTEIDPELKMEKEETMKRVTLAYTEKDFIALLRLEMEWVHKESLRADSLTDEKLKIYISALEDQIAQLKFEKSMLAQHPRFLAIAHLAELPEWLAYEKLRDAASNEKLAIKEFTRFKRLLESQAPFKAIFADIKGYLEAYVYNEPTFDDIEEFLSMMERK